MLHRWPTGPTTWPNCEPGPDLEDDCQDYIPVKEAAKQLGMSPVEFASCLRELRKELPLTGLTQSEREMFYCQLAGYVSNEEANDILRRRKASIHRLDWENYLKGLEDQLALEDSAETEAAEAPEAGKEALKARPAELEADYKARLEQVEAELDREGIKTHNEELTQRRDDAVEHPPVERLPQNQNRYEISITKAAEILGVTERTVSRWDTGQSTPEGYPGRKNAMAFHSFAIQRKMNQAANREKQGVRTAERARYSGERADDDNWGD